jgi:CspA family cold shock protein
MQTGKIKWFNPEKGFGFIRPDDGTEDIFLHISAVEEAGLAILQPGQNVKFRLEENSRNGKKFATSLETY